MIGLAEACRVEQDSSPWRRIIWASWALTARRDFGLTYGDEAAFAKYRARQQGATAQRTDLLPLETLDTVFWAALFALVAPEEAD